MKNLDYEWMLEYIKDDKKLVEYLYVLHYFFQKYWNSVNSYHNAFTKINADLWELLLFCIEEKYQKKDISNLLQYAIRKTWHNVFQVYSSDWVDISQFSEINSKEEILREELTGDAGVYIKSADNKIYKRFLLDDVRKIVWL